MFPLVLPTTWLSSREHICSINDDIMADWIGSERSLTLRIKELGNDFNVEVLNQVEQPLSAELKHKLACSDELALFREVLLKQGDVPLVYAQTIMPKSTVTGTETMLANLGNQSLGQVLFQSPQAVRSEIEFSLVEQGSQLELFISQQLQQKTATNCYIRRSLFTLNNKPLLVCECFLPQLFI